MRTASLPINLAWLTMHPALSIQELLLIIFGHCFPPGEWEATADLAALARTCRAFKDPALDVLWEELYDFSPLVRCLPAVSHQLSVGDNTYYTFRRIPTQDEWGTLRSYTRRIRFIDNLLGIDRLSAQRLWKAKPSLFQTLRQLDIEYQRRAVRMLFMPLPSLVSLTVKAQTLRLLEPSLISLSKTSPYLRELLLLPFHELVNMDYFDSSFICRWRNLQIVVCPQIFLDATTFVHLSTSTLTRLEFKLPSTVPDEIPSFDSPLVFSHLEDFTLHSEFLDPISCLLPKTRLPVVKTFRTSVEHCPSKEEIFSFLAGARRSGLCPIVQKLSFGQVYLQGRKYPEADRPVFGLLCLEPFMAFNDLRCIDFDVGCIMDLTDSELLTFVSRWPHLEELCINEVWGWNTAAGVTPNGLVQVLRTRPSLTSVALAFDTRDYTTYSPSIALTLPRLKSIDVLDSGIREGSVTAISAFLADILVPSPFVFLYWECQGTLDVWGHTACRFIWGIVFNEVFECQAARECEA